MWPQTNHSNSLSLSLLVYKMGMTIIIMITINKRRYDTDNSNINNIRRLCPGGIVKGETRYSSFCHLPQHYHLHILRVILDALHGQTVFFFLLQYLEGENNAQPVYMCIGFFAHLNRTMLQCNRNAFSSHHCQAMSVSHFTSYNWCQTEVTIIRADKEAAFSPASLVV